MARVQEVLDVQTVGASSAFGSLDGCSSKMKGALKVVNEI